MISEDTMSKIQDFLAAILDEHQDVTILVKTTLENGSSVTDMAHTFDENDVALLEMAAFIDLQMDPDEDDNDQEEPPFEEPKRVLQ